MAKKILIFILALCITVVIAGVLPIHGEEKIYNSVVRLHVLANSDSEEDQALKLAVRDAILKDSGKIFGKAKTREEAIAAIENNIDLIESTARETILSNGYDYSVNIELGEELYPTKNYESFAFPSGKYLSLRVMIGEAEGQNWWCVLFPPLCLDAAKSASKEDAFISVGLNPEEYKIITETENPKYKARFKILEIAEGIFN